jgi:UDP-glucose:glycoprotein glucosyltransferase
MNNADCGFRTALAGLVSMSTSVISAIQLPDPSESGLFDAPQRPRTRNYQVLGNKHT